MARYTHENIAGLFTRFVAYAGCITSADAIVGFLLVKQKNSLKIHSAVADIGLTS